MFAQSIASLALLAAFVSSSPCARDTTCNDVCADAVKALLLVPVVGPVASSDCVSFLSQTVTPCPVTSTSTAKSIVTATPVTVTQTVTAATNTQYMTLQRTATSVVTTIHKTVTVVDPTGVQVTSTVVVTTTPSAVLGRRDPAATCVPTTQSATNVPIIKDLVCSGPADYSAACSCASFTGSTSTLTPVTTVVTTTSTSTVTPTSTVTQNVTYNVPATVVQTQIVPATVQTTDATATVYSTFTQTTTVTQTAAAATPTICPSYQFFAANGSFAGSALYSGGGVVLFTNGTGNAPTNWALHTDGRITQNGQPWGSSLADQATHPGANSLVYIGGSGHTNNICQIVQGQTVTPNAVGYLSCTVGGDAIHYYDSPANDDTKLADKRVVAGGTFDQIEAVPKGYISC